ncbi:hypothetical protein FSP39_023768 [Pinctada imbricata]|uniref:Uncharacterized protein n=1 Tax=Pinctada imbricata TaxID=66713 RepID=A0AA88YKW7_PINIB|nr:hypothetical protein FSP39_023768 [Pinctada imbricata]
MVGRDTRDPGWLQCVPLWHFLSGKCEPFEDTPKDCAHDDPTPKWWGIADFTEEIGFFKAKTHWTMSAANMAGILHPTFRADYLMSRTFVAVLKFENLDEIFKTRFFPPEVLLASLYYHLKTHHYIQGSKKQSFMSLFHHLNDQLRDYQQKAETSSGECSLFNQSFICQKIGCDIVFLCLNNTGKYDEDLTSLAIVCCMLSLNYFSLCCKMRAEATKGKNKQPDKSHINRLDHIKREVLHWLKEKNSFFYNAKNELKIWNNIASVDFTNGVIIDCWKKEILKALEDKLTEKCMEKELMGLYCTNLDDFSKDVQAILSRVTLKALEKGAKLDLNSMNLNQALEYGRMLSQLLERNWPTSQDPTGILKFTLTWPPLNDFLRIFYDNVDKLQILSEVCHSHLSNAANVLKKTLEILTNGNIRMAEFNIVQKNVTVFIEACRKLKIVDIKGQQLEEHVTKLVQIRDTEFRTFQEMHVHVSNLIALCQHFKVNTGRLDQVMLDLQPVETVPLSSLCLPGDVTRILALDTYTPDIRVFELSDEQLEKCKSLSRSTTFMNIWINRGQRACDFGKRKLTMDEVFTEVMELCYQEWNQLANQLRQGKIRFSSFREYFKQTDHKFLEVELHAMSINGETDWIYERLKQIGQHSTIRQCSRGARVILEVVDRYGLIGNFKQIRQILSLEEGEDTEMCEIDESLMKACSVLKGMNEENIKSLETFIKCKPLVDWLRSAMKTGLRELKVFVELASISAGEGDMEVAKVNLLHSATTGYSPLIFNLDERCDSKIFLEKCQVVWRELESDPYLPRKLEDVLRQLEWLKTVRKAHGSVEISSMRQAEAINSKGIYCVGKLPKFRDIQNKKMSLDEVLQLMVYEKEEGKQLKKEYQYKELNELQSKLMLVAGKAEQGKTDVDMFTMVYDSIIRLCKVYIKLTSAGCVLYKDWHVQFLCDQKRPVCAFVKFGNGQTCNQLKGRRTETNDIDKIVPRLAKFMEKCLEEWMTYIDSKREEYIYLNYFTIDQLVILQRELVKLSEDSEPSKHVYPLLCAVKKNCTKADLIAAMRLAKQEVTKMENVRHEHTEADKDAASYSPQTNADVMKFVEEMEKVGYRKEIALAALEFCKPDEIDEGLVWCMEHESDIAVTQPHSSDDPSTGTNIQAEENFKGWTVSPQSMFSVTQDILQSVSVPDYMCEPDEDPLIQRLQAVWEKFLNSVSSSVSDYLSVEHLGLILSKLAATGDILNTVLTIYASDQNQPLPQSHEVLLCTPHTTLDEVDIFWRRALFNSQGNIHCMVNGDCLDYEVSDEGEKRLELYMINAKEKGVHYRLVVLCSSELEYRSRMVAALDRYKRDPLPLLRTDEIRDYILDKLKSQTQNRNIPAAAAIDFEK